MLNEMMTILSRTFPRFFFQTTPHITTKLEVEVENKIYTNIQPITVPLGTGVIIKPLGYISITKNTKVIRNPKSVNIYVHSTKINEKEENNKQKVIKEMKNTFSSQFLCHFEEVGYYNIHIRVNLVDEQGQEWNTSSKETVRVIVKQKEVFTRLSFI